MYQSDALQNIIGGNIRVVGAADNSPATGALAAIDSTTVALGSGTTKIRTLTLDASRVARVSTETRGSSAAVLPAVLI